MEVTGSISAPLSSPKVHTATTSIPWYIFSAVIAALSIQVGVLWDISWHMTIGRDGLFSAPHLAIYFGGVLAGIGGAFQLFKTTFAGSKEEKARSVWFWGFRAPLGAIFCIWGALAMATSAPFDDWWHGAYGLDVEILSPPHTVLALGIIVIMLGSLVTLLSYQNRVEREQATFTESQKKSIRLMYTFTVGMLIVGLYTVSTEYMGNSLMHSSIYYQIACAIFPFILIAAGRASTLKWPITWISIWYMGFTILMNWILQLFPASPMLGPIRTMVTHMVPVQFPMLLVIPALALDMINQRWTKNNDWSLSLVLGLVYFVIFLVVHWLYAYVAINPALSDNWLLFGHGVPFFGRMEYSTSFWNWDGSTANLVKGLAIAAVLAVASSRLGLAWGNWMKRTQR